MAQSRFRPAHPGSGWVVAAVREILRANHEERQPEAVSAPSVPWPQVMQAIAQHRLVPFVAPHAEALGMDAIRVQRISQLNDQFLLRGREVVRDAAELSRILTESNVEHLIVKGAALLSLLGVDPITRGSGDVDMWVNPRAAAVAELAVEDNGWRRVDAGRNLPRLGSGRRAALLLRLVNEQAYDHPERTTLDLHWKLAAYQPEMAFDFDDAHARSEIVVVGGVPMRTLCVEHALLHMSQHGRKEIWPTLRHLVDIVRLVDALGVGNASRMARSHRNVVVAIELASRVAPWTGDALSGVRRPRSVVVEEAWASCLSLENLAFKRKRLTGTQARDARGQRERWLWRSAPTWRSRAAWMVRLALPQALILRSRD